MTDPRRVTSPAAQEEFSPPHWVVHMICRLYKSKNIGKKPGKLFRTSSFLCETYGKKIIVSQWLSNSAGCSSGARIYTLLLHFKSSVSSRFLKTMTTCSSPLLSHAEKWVSVPLVLLPTVPVTILLPCHHPCSLCQHSHTFQTHPLPQNSGLSDLNWLWGKYKQLISQSCFL